VQGKGRGGDTAKKVGGGAVLGAIIGGIAGGGKGAAIGAAAGGGAGAGVQIITKASKLKCRARRYSSSGCSSPDDNACGLVVRSRAALHRKGPLTPPDPVAFLVSTRRKNLLASSTVSH